ncbi:hypothetical protein MTO96_025407 [Rhipicephalus appendiculatus]
MRRGAAMIWGARSLARNAAVVLLLHVALRLARASEVVADSTESNDAVDRLRRDSDQILIEHVKGVDDSQVTLSLFIGLLILAAMVLVILGLLGMPAPRPHVRLVPIRLSEKRQVPPAMLFPGNEQPPPPQPQW